MAIQQQERSNYYTWLSKGAQTIAIAIMSLRSSTSSTTRNVISCMNFCSLLLWAPTCSCISLLSKVHRKCESNKMPGQFGHRYLVE